MSGGEAIVARLEEASAAGHDGIVVVFPEAPEVRIPQWVAEGKNEPPQADMARRVVPNDPEWSWTLV